MATDITTRDELRNSEIIRLRIGGRSVHAIAKELQVSLQRVRDTISNWADAELHGLRLRKDTLALELARLDEMESAFYQDALAGNSKAGALCLRIGQCRALLLGLNLPQTHVLQIVNEPPRKTGIDRIEAALNALLEDGRKKDDPTTH